MPWGIAAAAVVGAYGDNQQSKAAAKGAKSQEASSLAAIEEQRRQYDQTRTDQLPWLDAGTRNLGQLEQLNSGNYTSFNASPDYKYAMDSSLGILDRYAASRGAYNAGGTDADRIKLASGLASQNYNNYYARIARIAGVGQGAAQSLGQFGANAANQIGGQYNNIGNAQASSYGQKANAWGNYADQLQGYIGYGMENNWGRG